MLPQRAALRCDLRSALRKPPRYPKDPQECEGPFAYLRHAHTRYPKMVRCRPFAHAASTREADLPVKFHAENTPALPTNRKGQSGKVLLGPQQDNLATSMAHFCIAVLKREIPMTGHDL